MKNVVGVIIIASVVTVGTLSYFLLTNDQSAPETDSGQATISEPVANPPVTQNQTPDTKEKNKQLPDLESFKGLEEESSGLFEAINDLPEGSEGDPLKDVLQ